MYNEIWSDIYSMNRMFDISSYLVIGKENTNGRPVEFVVEEAIKAGFTMIQIRSKVSSAVEIIECCRLCANVIKRMNKSDSVSLLVNDRLDVVLACREMGIKVDGIHVGQSDIPVSVCRKYLGENAIIGLSAKLSVLVEYLKNYDSKDVDYFGVAPLHETKSKLDCERDKNGNVITIDSTINIIKSVSKIPVVVGGGVTINDIPLLKRSGVDGFFVISAVAGAENPYKEAKSLVDLWNS